jgi:signal transduction histidine kinase/CheY-like chemotaxis protein
VSDSKYRTLFESIDEGFCVVQVLFDARGEAIDYVFLETNPSFERQTGLMNAVGRAMSSLAPGHEDHWYRTYGRVARTGKPCRFDAPAIALGRWYDVFAFQVGEPGQDLVAILFNDISRRKELERSVEGQNAALREADLRKDRFIATLSHELRNPLAPLKVAADLLAHDDLGKEQLARTREIIRRQVGYMARLLDDLLDISRVTQGKLHLRRKLVSPTELVDNAIEIVRPLIERKQHTLEVNLDASAPMLEVDPVRISQVVANLLNNAAKYTDAGGRIALTTRVEDHTFVVEVEDNGIGISPQALPGIFEIFMQQHADSERSEGGLGIGLSLVKGLVELHGGSVRAESAGLGSGSRFTVRLPIADGEPAPMAPRQASPSMHDRRRILIADDNRDAAESLALLLEHHGHDVRVAYDGKGAISIARTFRPDLALLDITMPKLDGYAVATALRAEPWASSLVLVAVTGWGDAEARKMAQDAGFDHHLTKPVGPDDLRELLVTR